MKKWVVIIAGILIGTPIGLFSDLSDKLTSIIIFIIISAVLLLISFYSKSKNKNLLIIISSNLFFISTIMLIFYIVNNRWSDININREIKDCVISTGKINEKYPEEVKDYCECAISNISNKISYYDYLKSKRTPFKDVDDEKKELISDCKEMFDLKIKKLEDSTNNISQ